MKYPYVRIERQDDFLFPYSVFVFYSARRRDWNNQVCMTESGAKRWAKRQLARGYKEPQGFEKYIRTTLNSKTYEPGEL